jgi:hypothetical protein
VILDSCYCLLLNQNWQGNLKFRLRLKDPQQTLP